MGLVQYTYEDFRYSTSEIRQCGFTKVHGDKGGFKRQRRFSDRENRGKENVRRWEGREGKGERWEGKEREFFFLCKMSELEARILKHFNGEDSARGHMYM